jgi:hypothetical protein
MAAFDIETLMKDPLLHVGLGLLGASSPKNKGFGDISQVLLGMQQNNTENEFKKQKLELEKSAAQRAEAQGKLYEQQVLDQQRRTAQSAKLFEQIQQFIGGNAGGNPAPNVGIQPPAAPPASNLFSTADKFVAGVEGGYTPNDAGAGPTNFGINQKANPDVNVKSLTPESASVIRKQRYWDKIGGDSLPPQTAMVAYDAAINQGQDYARQLIERTGGDPSLMLYQRRQDYRALAKSNPLKAPNLPVWEKRLDDLQSQLKATPVAETAPVVDTQGGMEPYRKLEMLGGAGKIAAGDFGGVSDIAKALKPEVRKPGDIVVQPGGRMSQIPDPKGDADMGLKREAATRDASRVALEAERVKNEQTRLQREQEKEDRLGLEQQRKVTEQHAKDKGALDLVGSAADRMMGSVDKILSSPGLNKITGLNSLTNAIALPGGAAKETLSELEGLKNKLVNDILQSVRSASANGASGYGSFTEKELEVIKGYVANLDPARDPQGFKDGLIQVKKFAEDIKNRSSKIYEDSTGKPAIEGLPVGARKIGTSGGKPVYQLPDGSRVMVK